MIINFEFNFPSDNENLELMIILVTHGMTNYLESLTYVCKCGQVLKHTRDDKTKNAIEQADEASTWIEEHENHNTATAGTC